MESTLNEEETQPDLVDEIYKEWAELCESRLGTDDQVAIDLDGDTITRMMETLADLHNAITFHFIKLAIYQRALEAQIDDRVQPPVGFSRTLPTT